MIRAGSFRILLLGVALVMLGLSPESALARSGHGGGGSHGGGYHGGSGWGGYHGGSGWGGSHGSGWGGYHGGGYHGGWGGYHGGGWGGYRRGWGGYGWGGGWGGWGCCGWGFGLSFNFGWPAGGWGYPVYVPYYAYPPYAYDPYSYYYYAPVGASTANPGYGAANVEYQERAARPATRSNALRLYDANYVSRPAARGAYAGSPARRHPAMRPEVENVIRAVRGMPPDAAQRALDSGSYRNLSRDELQTVREAAGLGTLN